MFITCPSVCLSVHPSVTFFLLRWAGGVYVYHLAVRLSVCPSISDILSPAITTEPLIRMI